MTTHETFRTRLLPEVLFHKHNKNLNIWSATCSTGQESYSIAMMVLDRSKKGIYSDFKIKRGINEDYLRRYFKNCFQGWEVNSNLKEVVTFSDFNLFGKYGWYSDFDFIFCRNVLIYFLCEIKILVLRKMASCLRTGGYLILGGA